MDTLWVPTNLSEPGVGVGPVLMSLYMQMVGKIRCQPLFASHRNFQDWMLQPSRTVQTINCFVLGFFFATLLTVEVQ